MNGNDGNDEEDGRLPPNDARNVVSEEQPVASRIEHPWQLLQTSQPRSSQRSSGAVDYDSTEQPSPRRPKKDIKQPKTFEKNEKMSLSKVVVAPSARGPTNDQSDGSDSLLKSGMSSKSEFGMSRDAPDQADSQAKDVNSKFSMSGISGLPVQGDSHVTGRNVKTLESVQEGNRADPRVDNSDEISQAPSMVPLRRANPRATLNGNSNSELLQPSQRLVKVQPQPGMPQPGAYAAGSFRVGGVGSGANDRSADIVTTPEPQTDVESTFLQRGVSGESSILSSPSLVARSSMGVAGLSVADDTFETSQLGPSNHGENSEDFADAECKAVEIEKKLMPRTYWLIGVLVLLLLVGVGAGVGVALSGDSDKKAPSSAPTPPPSKNDDCSLETIYEDCETTADGMFTADLPNCLLDRYQGLRQNALFTLDLDLNITEKKSCAPENLALLSLALHSTNNMTTTTLSNRFGLSMLYFATGGSGWNEQGEMLSEKSHWEWLVSDGSSTGFICFNDEVSEIILVSNNLNGFIPSTLMRFLPALQVINMQANDLTGTLPSALAGLVWIQLAGNQLTGTFPHVFAESTTLHSLDISGNKIVSRAPLSFPGTQWDTLVLDGVDFPPGPFPSSLLSLTDLSILSLGDTQRTGALPSEIGGLKNLKVLTLGGKNHINGTLPTELGNLVQLEKLFLASNSFSGTIPSELGRLTKLSELDLYKNKLTGAMPTEIGNLKNLQILTFHYNNFDGDIPDEVCVLDIYVFGLPNGPESSCPAEDFGGLVCPTQECCNC